MNGIEKITEKIIGDGTSFAEETVSAAKKEAAGISEEYAERARRAGEGIVERGREQAAEIERRICSVAQLEMRKATLAKKQELISQAFDKALEKLRSLDDATYAAMLVKFAVDNAVTGKEEVLLSQSDRSRFGKQVVMDANKQLEAAGKEHSLTLSAATADIDGGLVLKDGDVEANCALSAIVALLKEELALDVANALFD